MRVLSVIKAAAIAAALVVSSVSLVDGAQADESPRHSGPYIGLMAGYGLNQISPKGDDGAQFDWAQTGATGGVMAGFGRVVDGIYMGIEADAALHDLKGEVADGIFVKSSTEWVATIRVRGGIPIGPALLYATAGLAMGDSRLSVSGVGGDSDRMIGLVLGAGIDVELTRTMFVRLEGRHTRWKDNDFSIGGDSLSTRQEGETAVMGAVGFRLW
ncbi:MAG: porin family protein [Anaerolineae bacterium]|nr:porin family protein [Anaerolineae bacterium]